MKTATPSPSIGGLLLLLVGLFFWRDRLYPVAAFEFHVAPMQGYTNLPLRRLLHGLSPNTTTFLWTEMEKVPDLLAADAAGLQRRFGPPRHDQDDYLFQPLVLQLGGNHPDTMRRCLQHLSKHGYSFRQVNLNCGCPSVEAGGAASYGATLMKQPRLTQQLIAVLRKGCPAAEISLKCRIAVWETGEDVGRPWSAQEYEKLATYIGCAQEGGLSHAVVHARAAVLTGLSPTQNRQVPPLQYEVVERLAHDFPALKVTLNGGITGLSQCQHLARRLSQTSRISSLMAGRWMLRRPLDLALLRLGDTEGSTAVLSDMASRSAVEAVQKYASFVQQSLEGGRQSNQGHIPTLSELTLPIYLTSAQVREDYERAIGSVDQKNDQSAFSLNAVDMEEIYDTLIETISWIEEFQGLRQTKFSSSSIQFNRLNAAFKNLVGTKVANKWKRNRSEL
jgi:tRNA dihydrouridine synthase A